MKIEQELYRITQETDPTGTRYIVTDMVTGEELEFDDLYALFNELMQRHSIDGA